MLVMIGFLGPDGTTTTGRSLPEELDAAPTRALLREPNTRRFIAAEGGSRTGRLVAMDWDDVDGTKLGNDWFVRIGMLAPVLGPRGESLYGYSFLAGSAIGRFILHDWGLKWAVPLNGDGEDATAFMVPTDDIPRLVQAVLGGMMVAVEAEEAAKAETAVSIGNGASAAESAHAAA